MFFTWDFSQGCVCSKLPWGVKLWLPWTNIRLASNGYKSLESLNRVPLPTVVQHTIWTGIYWSPPVSSSWYLVIWRKNANQQEAHAVFYVKRNDVNCPSDSEVPCFLAESTRVTGSPISLWASLQNPYLPLLSFLSIYPNPMQYDFFQQLLLQSGAYFINLLILSWTWTCFGQ